MVGHPAHCRHRRCESHGKLVLRLVLNLYEVLDRVLGHVDVRVHVRLDLQLKQGRICLQEQFILHDACIVDYDTGRLLR